MGLSQTLATIPGVASPVLSGYIVQHQSAEEWNIVFYLAGAMFLVGALVFLVFGSGERQSWADQQHHPDDITQFCYTNSELSDDSPE
uniref:(California timema) hypothetical protein n=1 Tax=Timema californicum TaxID=61474 RepID=A0A7R9JK56_TIMCA|nr:unnamed protein product [Timema californicum]